MKKLTLVLIMLAGLSIVFGCSRVPSPKKVVQAYQAAHNAGDVDSVMALIYPDTRADFAGMGPVLWGPDELHGKAAYDSVLHSQYTLTIQKTIADSVFLDATESNDWTTEAGLPPFKFAIFCMVIRDGKIRYFHAVLDDASVDRFNGVMSQLIPWAMENRPADFEKMSSDLFLFSAARAQLSLDLLRGWKADGSVQK
jgi:ketosteroid isomerase-like protein